MSVQAGVLSFVGRPISPELVDSIDSRLRPFGAEAAGRHAVNGVALVHRSFHVTPEDVSEVQPHIARCGCVMTWDGRLDNRDDLIFDLWRQLGNAPTDVAIAAEAFSTWGVQGLQRLVGDWSLVVWDPRDRSVTLASDYAGIRALYYAEREGALHWSTSLAELVVRLDLCSELDSRFIVGYLTGLNAPELTPYLGVSSVPVGHALVWSRDGRVQRQRFWQLRTGRTEHKTLLDYGVEFRSVFARSVGSRLRAEHSVWAELSGGLDSSSVVCVADYVLKQRSRPQWQLGTVSCISSGSPESDERRFIAAVEEQRQQRSHYVFSESAVDSVDQRWAWVSPHHPFGKSLEMFRIAAQHGGRVLLSGRFGDVVMLNTPEDLGGIFEALAAGHVREVASRAHDWCVNTRRTVWDLTYSLTLEFLPASCRRRSSIGELLSPFGVEGTDPIEGAVQAFHMTRPLAQLWYEAAVGRSSRAIAAEPRGKRLLLADILDCTELRWLQSPPELSPVVYAHPYADRRLVEFMLSVPASVASGPGRPRALMKEALKDVLPARVLGRFSKGYADPLHLRIIKARLPVDLGDLDSWQVVQRSYVDRVHLRNALSDVRNGASRKLKNLLMVVSLERWLATREAQARAALC